MGEIEVKIIKNKNTDTIQIKKQRKNDFFDYKTLVQMLKFLDDNILEVVILGKNTCKNKKNIVK